MSDHSICIRQFITCPKCSHGYELALHSAELAKRWEGHKAEIERLRARVETLERVAAENKAWFAYDEEHKRRRAAYEKGWADGVNQNAARAEKAEALLRRCAKYVRKAPLELHREIEETLAQKEQKDGPFQKHDILRVDVETGAVEHIRPKPGCTCHKCGGNVLGEIDGFKMRGMTVCPLCGNKRCPKASDHDLVCTGSNEPGQPGSIY